MLRPTASLFTLVISLTSMACTVTSSNTGSECSGPGDCAAGETCVDGFCRKLCNSVTDCAGPRDVCDGGVCIPPLFDECQLDGDCSAAGICETSVGALCLNGGCVYPAVPCDAPDTDECFAGDGWFRAFGAPGTCGPPNDRCTYEVFEFACQNCATTCLLDCGALDCHDDGGGCRKNGHCNPGPPASCVYTDMPDGTACSLPTDAAGQASGRCGTGACRTVAGFCSGPNDCAAYETCINSGCLLNAGQSCGDNGRCADTCIMGSCAPPAVVGGECDAPNDDDDCAGDMVCVAGTCYVDSGGLCDTNDNCTDACISGSCTVLSSNGGPCDALDDYDCISAHECSDGICRRMDGQSCTQNDECAGTCVDNTCVPLAAPGSGCDDGNDCGPAAVSVTCAAGTCALADDGICSANNQCVNTCISGVCAALSGVTAACDTGTTDDNDDCSGALVCDSGTCRKANGVNCGSNNECVSGECECGNAGCTGGNRVCAATDCDCKYGTNGACTTNLTAGIDDPEDCVGAGISCYQGGCRADNQGTCTCPIPDPITLCTTCGNSSTCPGRTANGNSCGSGWGPSCPSCTAGTVCTYGCWCSCTTACNCTVPL